MTGLTDKETAISFFKPNSNPNLTLAMAEKKLSEETDLFAFHEQSCELINTYYEMEEENKKQWNLFCEHVIALPDDKPEDLNEFDKLLLLQACFSCLKNPIHPGEFARLIRNAIDLKFCHGSILFQELFEVKVLPDKRQLRYFLTISRLLIELHETPRITELVTETLPNLVLLMVRLNDIQLDLFATKYPEKNIEETMARFNEKHDFLMFPLAAEELAALKSDYKVIRSYRDTFQTLSLSEIKQRANQQNSTCELVALLIESMRRFYKIIPYDTQIIAILALLNTKQDQLKGRIAQIKTGEGKSTIIAMLAAFHACQSRFVDVITSSYNLARRDADKYQRFFESLGIGVCAIDNHSKKEDFLGQVIYGTSEAFKFAMLRDGLYQSNLLNSLRNGTLQPRTHDVAIVDEVDNLFLDTALNSALLSLSGKENVAWIYGAILNFVKALNKPTPITSTLTEDLRNDLQQKNDITHLKDKQLKRWLYSAQRAWFKLKEKQNYLVKYNKKINEHEIVIIDAKNTGRLNYGCQWKDGLHQFLQEKHTLNIETESLTAASCAHSSYFDLYKQIIGLTGTMGEHVERKEVEKIYNVDTFDVPPHRPILRQKLPAKIVAKDKHYEALLEDILERQKNGRPILLLFKTIEESEKFSQYLKSQGKKHQVINENQLEEEDFLVARAGELGMITIATNTAGRGTDILLSPQSKEAGGLHVVFTFYPDNQRVEDQGFGRAGRQNDPGTCSMILQDEDETILSLLKDASPFELIEYLRLGSLNSNNADEQIELLKKLRSHRIEQESRLRQVCSQKESVFFEKLQLFFKDIKTLYQTISEPSFKSFLIAACEECQHDSFINEPDNLNELYQPLIATAKVLYMQQCVQGKSDWSNFCEQLKDTYLTVARQHWANFYNQLHDEVDEENIDQLKQSVNQLYQTYQSHSDYYFNEPENNIIWILGNILHSARPDLEVVSQESCRL